VGVSGTELASRTKGRTIMPGTKLGNVLQNFIFELDGKPAGRLFGMSGGEVHADVIKTAGVLGHKHIGGVKFEDLTFHCGTGMAQAFYDWIGNTVGGSRMRKSGAIVAMQMNRQPYQRLEFQQALITKVEFPECNGSSKDPAYLTISISPEMTRSIPIDSTHPGVYVSSLPKSWHINDFKLTIDGLETECLHVSNIGALRCGQKVSFDAVTNKADEGPEEYSDLVVTLASNHATKFYDWFEGFVKKGKNSPSEEKKGLLQFFAPGANKAYFELDLLGLGPYEFNAMKTQSALPVDFKMYCNGMKFRAGATAIM
jgi:hypothetical protein